MPQVMLEQIESLRKTIDKQGDMINRLLELVATSQQSSLGHGRRTDERGHVTGESLQRNGSRDTDDIFRDSPPGEGYAVPPGTSENKGLP